jgi:hypothetical protein
MHEQELQKLRQEVATLRVVVETLQSDRLRALCVELDMEMDGVKVPHSAAAVLNAIHRVLAEEDDAMEEIT